MFTNCNRWLGRLIAPALIALIGLGTPYAAAAAGLAGPETQPAGIRQAGDGDDAPGFTTISDQAGIISVDIPAEWEDVLEDEWILDDETVGFRLTAAPDVEEFYADWGVPGIAVSYSEVLAGELSAEELLDTVDYTEACTAGERDTLPEGDLTGIYQVWEACGDAPTTAIVTALSPSDAAEYLVLLEVYLLPDTDADAVDRILSSLLISSPGSTTGSDVSLLELVDTSDLEYSYVEVQDPAIVALIPEAYSDTDSAVWKNSDGDALGFTYTAAPDIDEFNDTWTTPGLLVKSAVDLQEALDADEMLKDEELEDLCTYDDRYTETHEIGDLTYEVAYDRYDQCGDTDSSYIVMMAQTDPPDQLFFVDFLIVDGADEEAFDVLLQSFYLDPELATSTEDANTQGGATSGDIAFSSITDETGAVSVRVPDSWSEVESKEWDLGDGPIGVALTAAPDLVGFDETWEVPGVFVGVSDELAGAFTYDEVLDAFDFADDCSYDDRYEYTTDALEGAYDVWLDCGDVEGGNFVVLAAVPAGEAAPIIFLYMNMPAEQDVAAFGEVVDSLAVAGALETPVADEEAALLEQPLAVVGVDRLNVRSGPGTAFNRVSVVTRDTALVVEGQIDNCAWLKVTTPDGLEGWVSGSSDFVTLDTRCSEIPEAEETTEPASAAPAAPAASSTTSSSSDGGNASEGCYLFNNGYGVELNFTFTDSGGKGTTFQVPKDGSVEKCLAPGKYTYTLDAPPPWNSINGDFSVEAGDNVQLDLFP